MPLPKPLKRGASKAAKQNRIGEVMHDLKHGAHHKDRTRKQEIAIAEKSAGNAKPNKQKPGNRRKRNIGRS